MRALLLLAFAPLLLAQPGQQCTPCHNEQIADLKTHKHSTQANMECALCHGPSQKHRESTGNVPPDRVTAPEEIAAFCGNCHLGEKNQYLQSRHRMTAERKGPRVPNCNTCHGHHAARTLKAIEAGCNRCHTTTPEACKKPPAAKMAGVSCMGCHARHTLVAAGN